jgi:hypothetical protein
VGYLEGSQSYYWCEHAFLTKPFCTNPPKRLPRQAQDEHRKLLKTKTFFCRGCGKAGGNCSADPLSSGHDMWHDLKPGTDVVSEIFYSANFYTSTATSIIKEHAANNTAANPMFLCVS